MELSSIIMGLACIALFAVPIFLLQRSGSRKHKQLRNALQALGQKNGLHLSETEVWNDCAIGIDMDAQKVIYISQSEENSQEVLIDLKEINRCAINNVSREVKTGTGMKRVIERLDLQFFHSKSDVAPVAIEFYNGRKQMQLSGEIQLAEKWVKLIKQAL